MVFGPWDDEFLVVEPGQTIHYTDFKPNTLNGSDTGSEWRREHENHRKDQRNPQKVAQAIAERDAEFIQDLAKKQAEAGATWLDVNAGTHPDREPDDLIWLIESIQSVVDTPLSLDSANPKALRIAIQAVNKTPMINSISGEPERLTGILPIVAEHGCPVIALAMDDKGIPATAEGAWR